MNTVLHPPALSLFRLCPGELKTLLGDLEAMERKGPPLRRNRGVWEDQVAQIRTRIQGGGQPAGVPVSVGMEPAEAALREATGTWRGSGTIVVECDPGDLITSVSVLGKPIAGLDLSDSIGEHLRSLAHRVTDQLGPVTSASSSGRPSGVGLNTLVFGSGRCLSTYLGERVDRGSRLVLVDASGISGGTVV